MLLNICGDCDFSGFFDKKVQHRGEKINNIYIYIYIYIYVLNLYE